MGRTMKPENVTPVISVVIPTVGRASKLDAALTAFRELDRATPPWEVIVVLDGPDAESRTVIQDHADLPIVVREQPAQGTGPARNRGSGAATGEIVLFLNDDTCPHPFCLQAHFLAQRELGPCLTLGRNEWDPSLEVTSYMAWLAPAGHQFNYQRLDPCHPVPWDACWGTNLGVPRAWLLDEPFDEDHCFPALEDGEWGYRQARRGRIIRYVPHAIAYHDHRYDGPADYRFRATSTGKAARHVVRRHPELRWKLVWRPAAIALARLLSMAYPGNWRRALWWDLDFRLHVLRGLISRT